MRPVQKVLSAGIAYVATSASGTPHPHPPRRLRKIPSLGKVCPGQARRSQARTVFDMHSSHNLVASFSSEAMSSGLTFDPGHGPPPHHPTRPQKPASRQGCSLKSVKPYIPRLRSRPPPSFGNHPQPCVSKNRELGANQAFRF